MNEIVIGTPRKLRRGERVKEIVEPKKQKQKKSWRFWKNERGNNNGAEGSRDAVNSDPSIGTNDVPSNGPSSGTSATAVDGPCIDAPIADNFSNPEAATDLELSQEAIPAGPISYWDQAAKRLSEENPEVYKSFQEIRKDIPHEEGVLAAAMMDVINRHKETMEERQWSLPFKVRGREVKIRDQLNSVLKAVQVFKDFGSGLAALDPVHAGIPWAVVNIVLQVALNDSDQTEAALEGLSEISPIICRYTEIECIYLKNQDTTNLRKDFERCLIDLYMKVLEYEVATVYHCKSNAFKRFAQAIPKLVDWRTMIQTIKLKDSVCQGFTQIFDSRDRQIQDKNLLDIIEEQERKMDRKMDEIQRNLRTVAHESEHRKNKDVLSWICNVDPLLDHKRILEGAKIGSDYANSGQWLFDHEDFVKWSTDVGDVLTFWLRGPVGSGKSSLVSRVIEWHLGRAITNSNEQVAYFYCSKKQGQPEGSEPVHILQSLVRQLAWSPEDSTIANPIKVAWKDGGRSREDKLSLEECSKILLELFGRCQRTTIILDALDECAKPKTILEILKSLGKKSVTLSLFVSSRNEVKVSQVLSDCSTINLESSNTSKDIDYFIRHEVNDRLEYERLLSGKYPELEEQLINVLHRRAQGSFQWVRLQLAIFYPRHSFKNPDDVKDKLTRLDSEVGIPSLAEVYDEIYETNTKDEAKAKEHAMRAYKWVLCSNRPLNAAELAEAVSIDYNGHSPPYVDRDYVLQICSNLIIVVEQDIVQFAHLSVREYLQKSPQLTDMYSDLQAHTQIAESCLAYITHSHTKFSEIASSTRKCFGEYAIAYWPLHCERAAENRRKEGSLRKLFANLLLNDELGEAFTKWIITLSSILSSELGWDPYVHRLYNAISSPPSTLFAACAWGFTEVICDALEKGSASKVESNISGLTCLHVASKTGHEAVVQLLLQHKADVDAKDKHGQTALHRAAGEGHETVVQLLLEHKAEVDGKDGSGRTALHWAVSYGHEAMVQLLLEHKAEVDVKDKRGRTALHWAVSYGHEAVVQLLLEHKAEVNGKDGSGRVVLHWAVSYGHTAVLQLLLEHKAEVNGKDGSGMTALHWAVFQRHTAVVQLLLEYRVDVNVEDRYGMTALHLAAEKGHEAVVQLLLEHKADVGAKNQDGKTALDLAAEEGHGAVVRLLELGNNSQLPGSLLS